MDLRGFGSIFIFKNTKYKIKEIIKNHITKLKRRLEEADIV